MPFKQIRVAMRIYCTDNWLAEIKKSKGAKILRKYKNWPIVGNASFVERGNRERIG